MTERVLAYRALAIENRQIAARTVDKSLRKSYRDLATAYDRLADQIEEMLKDTADKHKKHE